MTLYYQNQVLEECHYPAIAIRFSLPIDVVEETVAQIRLNGTPHYHVYDKSIADKIESMAGEISEYGSFEPAVLNNQESVEDRAANHLMVALADPVNNSFIVNIDGTCSINPDRPPELVHSYQVVANVLKLRDLGGKIDDKSSWMLGSIVHELRNFHGEAFEVGQVCNQTTAAYNTIYTAEEVFKAFKTKRYALPYTSHKEAYFAAITDEQKHLVLHKAETYELTSKHVRSLCNIIKRMEDDTTVRNIRSKDQALVLIEAINNLKANYLVYQDSTWTRISGTTQQIPTGTIVIDMKNWTVRKNNDEPVEIERKKRLA